MEVSSKSRQAVFLASACGLVAITLYIVVERSIATGISLATGTEQLLQWDAANAFGVGAFSGGWSMAGAGLLMDAVVSACWAAVFAALYVNVALVRRYLVPSGIVYGALVMCVMIFAVVPIGHAPQPPRTLVSIGNTLVAHTLFFGLPVALAIRQMMGDTLRSAR